MRWPPWRRAVADRSDEAQEHLDRLKRQQPKVDRLARELRQARDRNGFSDLVMDALRGRPGPEGGRS